MVHSHFLAQPDLPPLHTPHPTVQTSSEARMCWVPLVFAAAAPRDGPSCAWNHACCEQSASLSFKIKCHASFPFL